jgi:DNA-directed RNA polymerase beta subunit
MGYETMYDPTTGKALPNKVFLGVVSIQVLRHFADQKVQSRGWYGSVNSRTEQPNKPSSGPSAKMGGNKQGELEVDSAHAHGAAGFLNQVLSTLSDQAKIPLCQNCHSCLILKYDNNTYRCETCERDTKVYIVGHMRYATNYLKNVISPFVGMGMTWTTEARIRGRPRELREEEGEDEIEEEDDE